MGALEGGGGRTEAGGRLVVEFWFCLVFVLVSVFVFGVIFELKVLFLCFVFVFVFGLLYYRFLIWLSVFSFSGSL